MKLLADLAPRFLVLSLVCLLISCASEAPKAPEATDVNESVKELKPQYTIKRNQTHNRFSRAIPPLFSVPSGSVIEAFTNDDCGGLIKPGMTQEEYSKIKWPEVFGHPLSGPVFVEGAEPGNVLAVKLLKIEIEDWGHSETDPNYAFLGKELEGAHLKTFKFDKVNMTAKFSDKISIPLRPFPGVIRVAPDTDEMLLTMPPRASGGNMDDPDMVEGTTIYLPVFVKGALVSIGDTHAAQGFGEVSGTAIEAPMRVVYRVDVIKGGRKIVEPEYEGEDFYAVTGNGKTIEEAAKKATRFMIAYLVAEHGLELWEANILCSIAANLKITEVVDGVMFVSMHISKEVLGSGRVANQIAKNAGFQK